MDNTYTKQADIYSFGICLYQLLNDFCFPFEENCLAEEAIDRRMNGEPLPLPKNASPEFGRIILKACAYDPAIRYQTMDDFLADLRKYSFSSGNQNSVPVMGGGTSLNNSFSRVQPASSVPPVQQNSFSRGVPQNPFSQPQAVQGGAPSRMPEGTTYAGQSVHTASGAAAVKKKSKLPLVLGLIALLAAAGGITAFFLLKDKDDDSGSRKKSVDHPSDAVEFDGHYYKYFDSHMTWKDAEAYCVENGGHLVSVNSSEEQEFLTDLTRNESEEVVWVGAYRVMDDMDTWYWTDGTDFDYTNWATISVYGITLSFPANHFGKCYYALYYNDDEIEGMDRGSWMDMNNTLSEDGNSDIDTAGFVCEWQ